MYKMYVKTAKFRDFFFFFLYDNLYFSKFAQ